MATTMYEMQRNFAVQLTEKSNLYKLEDLDRFNVTYMVDMVLDATRALEPISPNNRSVYDWLCAMWNLHMEIKLDFLRVKTMHTMLEKKIDSKTAFRVANIPYLLFYYQALIVAQDKLHVNNLEAQFELPNKMNQYVKYNIFGLLIRFKEWYNSLFYSITKNEPRLKIDDDINKFVNDPDMISSLLKDIDPTLQSFDILCHTDYEKDIIYHNEKEEDDES